MHEHVTIFLFLKNEAALNWVTYLAKRGVSVISDVFEGQFQSSMQCGECKQVHVTDDQ